MLTRNTMSITRATSRVALKNRSVMQTQITASFYNTAKLSAKSKSPSSKGNTTRVEAKSKGTSSSSSSSSSIQIDGNSAMGATPKKLQMDLDPHQTASKMIKNSSDTRIAGTEAVASISPQEKMRNYATALALLGFCTSVYLYSLRAVGRPDGGMDEFLEEADEARKEMKQKSEADRKAEELVELDDAMSQLSAEIGEDAEEIMAAVAAPEDFAQDGEELINDATRGKGSGSEKKPLWKKVVFFWRRG